MQSLIDRWRRRRARRELVGELVTRLDGASDIEAVLRATLGDPTLRVCYPLDDGTRFVSAGGEPVALPAEQDSSALVTPLKHDGELVAVVIHDPALAGDGRLLAGVAGASALAAANARLAAELEASVAEVRLSRARLVAAGDAARRQVERDLHDGAQQRLVAAALDARLAMVEASDPTVRAALERTYEQLQAALTELRELARGLYPAVLPERGLAAAVNSLAERTDSPVEIDALPADRFPPEVEASAYFCVASAMAAADGPLRVSIVRAADGLQIKVAGVSLSAADAQELRDRVEAIDGTLEVTAAPGGSAGYSAVLPVAHA